MDTSKKRKVDQRNVLQDISNERTRVNGSLQKQYTLHSNCNKLLEADEKTQSKPFKFVPTLGKISEVSFIEPTPKEQYFVDSSKLSISEVEFDYS